MGNYNPHAPLIIGPEWVPIREANYVPDKVTEQGYTFHIDHSATPVTGAYYVDIPPQTLINNVADLISIYPVGQETLTGPIKQVLIPASAIWVTGSAIDSSGGVAALQNPSDDKAIIFTAPSDFATSLGISFDVLSYSQQLFGKRILDVSFRYSISAYTAELLQAVSMNVGLARDIFTQQISVINNAIEGSLINSGEPTKVASFSLGSMNFLYDATRDINTTYDIYPWRYQELARFAATEPAGSRTILIIFNNIPVSFLSVSFFYVEMVVTYCEETRVLYGGRRTFPSFSSTPANTYATGPNLVRMLNPSFATGTALTPGDYTVTLTHDDYPASFGFGAPPVKALRELYLTPPQEGVRINKSVVVDDTFTMDVLPVIPELTLHTSSAVVTGTHPYGRQDDIPVYGSITAIQEIEDDPVGTSKSFPYVRFYARRFGDTNVPLTLVDAATGLSTVSISVEDFDTLTEIVDGWREVNLTFTVPPSFATAAGDIDWRWQAPGELARNQWQVLGMGSQTFTAHSIGPASYYAPQGDTVDLTWQSPLISGTAEDTLSDAVLIFSQDPAPVTGFAVNILSQAVTGVTEFCDLPAGCIATAIKYNQLSWPYPPNSAYLLDTFTRTVSGSWGSTETPVSAWTISGSANEYSVRGTYGAIAPFTNGSSLFATVPYTSNFDITADLGVLNNVVATSTARAGIAGRYTNSSNYYLVELRTAPTTGVVTALLIKRVAATDTTLSTFTLVGLTNNAGGKLRVRFMGMDDRLKFKVWDPRQDQPSGWLSEVTDTSLTTGANMAFFARSDTVAGNTMTFDNLTATPPSFWFGGYEVQRRDDITDWQTIMYATSPAVTGFADYEARVGMASEYRIRQCNVLDFCSSVWVTGTGTIPSPGVTISGDGNSILVFTSNEQPLSNLAYVMQWENQPIETFAFPEADQVQLQRMFGKDFFTAFHPLERDGEQFTRTILVNAAAIPAPSLANFRGLRDLAWADINYVCVRDELGNRWYANVRVPDGVARMDRTIYLAQIQVSEVTDTPTPVDPEVM